MSKVGTTSTGFQYEITDEAMNDEFSMDIPGDEEVPAEGTEEGAEGAEPDQE